MTILYFIFGLIALWAIVSIFTEKHDDKLQREKMMREIEKEKEISKLEREIRKIKGE